MIEALIPLGGLLNRLRGDDAWGLGLGKWRLIVGACTGLFAFALTLDPWTLLIAPGTYIGLTSNWGESMDLGHMEGVWWQDALGMAGWGTLFTLPVGIALAFLIGPQWWWYVPAGTVLLPLAYAIGWAIHNRWGIVRWWRLWLNGPAGGELMFGCFLWAAVAAVGNL